MDVFKCQCGGFTTHIEGSSHEHVMSLFMMELNCEQLLSRGFKTISVSGPVRGRHDGTSIRFDRKTGTRE